MDRIKGNVRKMASMNAPEEDIDGYIASEGVTVEQVRDYQPGSPAKRQPVYGGDSEGPMSPMASDAPVPMPEGQPEAPSYPFEGMADDDFKAMVEDNLRDPSSTYQSIQQLARDAHRPAFNEKEIRDYLAYRDQGGTRTNVLVNPQSASGPDGGPSPSQDSASSDSDAKPTDWSRMARIGWNGLVSGLSDTAEMANAPAYVINRIMEKVTGKDLSKSALEKLGVLRPDASPETFAERALSEGTQIAGGSVLPLGAARSVGAKLLKEGGEEAIAHAPALSRYLQHGTMEIAKRPGLAAASDAAASAGGGVGGELAYDATEGQSPTVRNAARFAGQLAGGVVGGSMPNARSVSNAIGEARFMAKQADNPHAITDAQIADDVARIVSEVPARNAGGRKLAKGQRESTINSRIDDLERSYLPFDDVAALDISRSHKARLRKAMEQRHTLSSGEVEALHAIPGGKQVADAITKAKRLRTFVPEGSASGDGGRGLAGMALDTAATGVASLAAGPKGAMVARLASQAIGTRSGSRGAIANADAAKALAKLQPRYAKTAETMGANETSLPVNREQQSLRELADTARDASDKFTQRIRAEKAAEKAETARLESEGQRLITRNALDNVKPSGGYRGYLYDRTGLLPEQQDVGALSLLKDGKMTQEHFDMFLGSPDKLQTGNAGNAILDRLAAMAEDGALARDPKWSPSSSPPATEGAEGAQAVIRNPIAYAATAKGNQARVLEALSTVGEEASLGMDERTLLRSTINNLGNTSSRKLADAMVSKALKKLPASSRPFARSVLEPLVAQIKR